MIRALGNLGRLLAIARILAHHDALFPLADLGVAPAVTALAGLLSRRNVDGRPGERLARALTEAGPSFIKLGQALSTRADLLGEEMAEDLSKLQDRLAPFGGAQARATVEDELGEPIDHLFSRFDDDAVATASIAQVHFAVTSDGREVAVKILRPGIERAFQRDVALLRWIASVLERTRPDLKRLKPEGVVDTFADTVEVEMDLRFEAAAAAELRENFEDDEDFMVPEVDWGRTSQRVLTTERLIGIPLDDRAAIQAAGHDPEVVLEKAARATFKQIFRDGFFHADAHPGNLFVKEDGRIGAVDFGIMGRLDLKTRKFLGELLLAFLVRDYRRAAEVHFEAGWVPAHRSVDAFTQASRSIAEPILDKPQNEISIGRLLGQLFQITETFHMETQPQLLLLQKTMLVAEGTARKLSPDANMWLLARPLIEDWMLNHLGPEARLRDTVDGLADAVGRLPRVLNDIKEGVGMLTDGRVKLHPDTIRALRNDPGGNNLVPAIWIAVLFFAVVLVFVKIL